MKEGKIKLCREWGRGGVQHSSKLFIHTTTIKSERERLTSIVGLNSWDSARMRANEPTTLLLLNLFYCSFLNRYFLVFHLRIQHTNTNKLLDLKMGIYRKWWVNSIPKNQRAYCRFMFKLVRFGNLVSESASELTPYESILL